MGVAFLFPGQGAQHVGMGRDFYETFRESREVFEEASDLLSLDLAHLCFFATSEELVQTKNSQIAIFVASYAMLRAVQKQFPQILPSVCAGLSLGEYTALAAAGKVTFADCAPLVRARGLYMQEACETCPGTMQVVLGLAEADVEACIASLQPKHAVWVANLNCPGQVVIAGTREGLEVAAPLLKERGAKRILPLEVSGAFHSGLMAAARDRLAPYLAQVAFHPSSVRMVMNVPGGFVDDLEAMRANLIQQVTAPVRWERGIRAMEESGVHLYVEIGPGTTLLGMNRKIGTQKTISIHSVADLEQLSSEEIQCLC